MMSRHKIKVTMSHWNLSSCVHGTLVVRLNHVLVQEAPSSWFITFNDYWIWIWRLLWNFQTDTLSWIWMFCAKKKSLTKLSPGGDFFSFANASKWVRKKRKFIYFFWETQIDILCLNFNPSMKQFNSFSGLICLRTPARTCSDPHLRLSCRADGSSSRWCKLKKRQVIALASVR